MGPGPAEAACSVQALIPPQGGSVCPWPCLQTQNTILEQRLAVCSRAAGQPSAGAHRIRCGPTVSCTAQGAGPSGCVRFFPLSAETGWPSTVNCASPPLSVSRLSPRQHRAAGRLPAPTFHRAVNHPAPGAIANRPGCRRGSQPHPPASGQVAGAPEKAQSRGSPPSSWTGFRRQKLFQRSEKCNLENQSQGPWVGALEDFRTDLFQSRTKQNTREVLSSTSQSPEGKRPVASTAP